MGELKIKNLRPLGIPLANLRPLLGGGVSASLLLDEGGHHAAHCVGVGTETK